LSDDRHHGLTIIGFVGSVFSPYYFHSRKYGASTPENFCSINVALYGPKSRWAMTEYGARFVTRQPSVFQVGPSSMVWNNQRLVITIDERCVPLPLQLSGTVTLTYDHLYDAPITLDDPGKHYWQAVAPYARVETDFKSPDLRWHGSAYHDMNWGEEPLEQAFSQWTWQRVQTQNGSAVYYDIMKRDGTQNTLGLGFEDGAMMPLKPPPLHSLQTSFWRIKRQAFSEQAPVLVSTLENAPFYARNHVRVIHEGQSCDAMHESLLLQRFQKPWVQKVLPYRMLRKA
jgi:carotenoid 1,2-hydratase